MTMSAIVPAMKDTKAATMPSGQKLFRVCMRLLGDGVVARADETGFQRFNLLAVGINANDEVGMAMFDQCGFEINEHGVLGQHLRQDNDVSTHQLQIARQVFQLELDGNLA